MKLIQIMNNFHVLENQRYAIYFSYETPIGVSLHQRDIYVSENKWGRTTGKHINYIKNNTGAKQIPFEELNDIIQIEID